MQLYRTKKESHLIQENPVSTFIGYELPFTTFSTGVSIINGRYPESGYDMDTGVDATWYIVSGTGRIFLIDIWYEVGAEDMLFVPR
jgi:mannose-6-phosphate isomerase-like protein (cupin superfamily)